MSDIEICDPIAEHVGTELRSGHGIGPLSITPSDPMCRMYVSCTDRDLGYWVGMVGRGHSHQGLGKDYAEPETTISNLITPVSLC